MAVLTCCVIIATLVKSQILAGNALSISPEGSSLLLQKPPGLNNVRNPYDVIAISRRQIEQIPEYLSDESKPEPSCAQLRVMWNHMRRMARHREITNEVPMFPLSFPRGLFSYVLSHPSFSGNHGFQFPTGQFSSLNENNLGEVSRGSDKGQQENHSSAKDKSPRTFDVSSHNHHNNNQFYFDDETEKHHSRGQINPVNPLGTFVGVPHLQKSLGVFGTVLQKPQEKTLLEEQKHLGKLSKQFRGSGEFEPLQLSTDDLDSGFGTFGDFTSNLDQSSESQNIYNFGSVLGDRPPMKQHISFVYDPEESKKETGSEGEFSDAANLMESCNAVKGNLCRTDDDCSCFNNVLQCVAARCQLQQPQGLFTDDWGMWHSGPVDSVNLGISRKKRDSARVVAM
ncbi:uncharacterized protein LOC111087266 isoform X2 [Limulus polyphemus]|uniref:Uncharacterized protein LOC111087266 isoform X2 n=1 Tax=Limulus polyphemus TaxID=6850 RepID=A0ABM1SZG6_LIMPO|nr:uncharacterized protein LOC111087266 isoform X2 [Limulus polyphemus]